MEFLDGLTSQVSYNSFNSNHVAPITCACFVTLNLRNCRGLLEGLGWTNDILTSRDFLVSMREGVLRRSRLAKRG